MNINHEMSFFLKKCLLRIYRKQRRLAHYIAIKLKFVYPRSSEFKLNKFLYSRLVSGGSEEGISLWSKIIARKNFKLKRS